MKNLNGKRVNSEGLESEDLKKINNILDDERTRGINYNVKLTGLLWEILGAL
jgi:hypothetical protein